MTASTTALRSDDATYASVEASIASLVSQRDALASPISAALDGAEFAGQPIDSTQAQSWITQAQALVSQAASLDTTPASDAGSPGDASSSDSSSSSNASGTTDAGSAGDGGSTTADIDVYRVGSGTGTLTNLGNPVFVDEFTPAGALVRSISLPSTGPGHVLVASGTASSEGFMTLSTSGKYLVLTGYDAPLPLSGPDGGTLVSSTVARVVARIDAAGTIDTSTALTDSAPGNNPRSAATTDGTNLWFSGAAGGVRFARPRGGDPGGGSPSAQYTMKESVALAFVAALQVLTPPQRAVLLLRDVVGLSAAETAEALACSVSTANSTLHRARVAVQRRVQSGSGPRLRTAWAVVLVGHRLTAEDDAHGRIQRIHDGLDEDEPVVRPRERGPELLHVAHDVTPRVSVRTEDLRQVRVAPVGDIVVLRVLAEDGPLDRVAAVVDEKDDRLQIVPQDRRQLLRRQLERPVADEEELTPLRGCHQRPEQCSDRVPDRSPERLRDVRASVREREPGGAGSRRPVLDDEDVAWPDERLQLAPVGLLRQLVRLAGRRTGGAPVRGRA